MFDYLNRSLTTGRRYMNSWDCSGHDWITLIICSIAIVWIVYRYFKIYKRKTYAANRSQDEISKRYFKDFANVFLFCAISGYALDILFIFWKSYILKALFLITLAVLTERFWRSIIKSRSLEKMLSQQERLNTQIDDLSMRLLSESFRGVNSSISKSDLLSAPFNEQIYLNKSKTIYAIRVYPENCLIQFLTVMEPGSSFDDWHNHPDLIEVTKVIEGDCTDGKHFLIKGDSITYKQKEKHKVSTHKGCELIVKFYDV